MSKMITISRQFGSGGRTIGKEVAERLKIPCYDQEIIERVASESGYDKKIIEERGEYAQSSRWFGNALASSGNSGRLSLQDSLWVSQRAVILDLAQKGPAVFVGRCADYILAEKYSLLRAFIYADTETRIRRIVENYGESPVAPEKRLKEKDKRRTAYYRYYTDLEWGDPANYDICLNSGALGIDKCCDILEALYRAEE